MEPWQRLQPLIDRIVPVALNRGLGALPTAERNVFLVWSYPAAVNDGGHASFFYNSYGEFAHETVQALRDVGATDYARILDRAIDLFPQRRIPRDIEERNAAVEALPVSAEAVMERLDEDFFALGGDPLLATVLTYFGGCI